ncbi:MAG: phosphatase PAP2 family protein [Thermodesulfovibrio sp.]|uniref:phosphatase PAP2 family protein n=1 Tax=unclassified Thermodesulfovibrio TaxID=2645936 RepID=UPI00157027E1|nr:MULTISPECIES: phosphatase PAP2 family protein [unclassified Thermodesulfovibrio]MDI1470977.1 phosphatase PAP2 family protein [Thermodesulfovibrio sp. 1176]MDI6713827.1 phosphatase PAP2 family protein [Thermodesulfovibrio sp.]
MIIFSSMALFQFFLCKQINNSCISFIKNIAFPVFSVLVAFDTVGVITPFINKDIDLVLLELDYMILGFYPYLYFEKIANPLITELMQLSYCVYYILPFLIGVLLIKEKKWHEFYKVLFLILLCYYLSYTGYILFPALGPRYSIPEIFQSELRGLFLADYIKNFLNSLEGIKRDAFPSGHVGISLLILILIYRYSKKIFWLMFFPVLMLILSTVYCRYHYFVDILGGILLTIVTLVLGNLYYNFWLTKNENSVYKR